MLKASSILNRKSPSIAKASEILDILFPSLCPACEDQSRSNSFLCSACSEDIDYLDLFSTCKICGHPFGYFKDKASQAVYTNNNIPDDHLCAKCVKDKFSFNSARSIALYSGALKDMVHAFKYEGKLKLGNVLTDIIIKNYPFKSKRFDVVVPVPLYIKKLRQRHYNQSAVLASNIARIKGLRSDPYGLIKIRDTVPQFEIREEAERKKNVRGAFGLRYGSSFNGLSVLLIDDVFTTGSTSDECAKTVLKSGALSVDVLTLSRAGSI